MLQAKAQPRLVSSHSAGLKSAGRVLRSAPRTARCAATKVFLAEAEQIALKQYGQRDKAATLDLLKHAGLAKTVPPEEVEGALLRLEQLSTEEGLSAAAQIEGRWHLVFGTATKIRAFQYIPVREELVVDMTARRIALESAVGPFSFFINGVINAWNPETRALDFQFTQVDIKLFDNQLWTVKPKTKPKTYTWYYVSDTMSAARSSAGGLALLMGRKK